METAGNFLEVMEWGRLAYGAAYERQRQLVQERLAGRSPDRLVLVEHLPVVTVGRSGNAADVHLPDEMLRKKGVARFAVDRGGRATYHGPGQMVAYPILKLRKRDLHVYVNNLLEAVAFVLRNFGLRPVFKEGAPGLWVDGKKIASIGIAIKKWVTYHGVALNVNPDLKAFDWIIPCGHPDEVMTSMAQALGHPVAVEEVKQQFVRAFARQFGYPAPPAPLVRPAWFTLPLPDEEPVAKVERLIEELRLETVCQRARCPNLHECFGRGTATFMILGSRCTRNCRFCAVDSGCPESVDAGEPQRTARAVRRMKLQYVVITSVTRDDLEDHGAGHFVRTISAVRALCPETRIEILIPDFKGSHEALQQVCRAQPDMFNHNIETVPRLYPSARPQAKFDRSLGVLEFAAKQGLKVKSGMMLGLGERQDEIAATLSALLQSGCRYLTLGQYLPPSGNHLPVARYVTPEEFDRWTERAHAMGFEAVASGPLIRSSYRADKMAVVKDKKNHAFSLA